MTTIAPVTTDVALLGTIEDIARLPAEEQPAYITAALAESRKWLHLATESTNPRPFAEVKAWAASVAEYARQKGLASEIVADGQEMLRRAERAVGQAVRNGQAVGEIRTHADNQHVLDRDKLSVGDIFKHKNEMTEVYAMTDGVTDGEFDDALGVARSEGNLSRANVVRKVAAKPPASITYAQNRHRDTASPQTRGERADLIAEMATKGYAAAQMVEKVGVSEERIREIARAFGIDMPGEKVMARTKRLNAVLVIRETVALLDSLRGTDDLISDSALAEADPVEAEEWLDSIDSSIKGLRSLSQRIRRVVQP